jgi:hypothetical protein
MSTLRSGLSLLTVASIGLGSVLVMAPAASAAAAVGSCYEYPLGTVGKVASAAPVIGCESPHTAETWWVGALAPAFGLPSKASHAARLQAGRPCTTKAMNTYLGIPDRKLPSRYRNVVLFPTDAQWNAGERWVRCDVVLQSGLSLQQTTGTAASFVATVPQDRLTFCTPGTPSARKTAAVPCTNPKKNWIKVLDKELGGPNSRFPGTSTVLRRSAVICQKIAKQYDGKIPYPGWWRINPTQHGWNLGKRSVQCFVPYDQYLKELAQRAPKPVPTPVPAPTPPPTV